MKQALLTTIVLATLTVSPLWAQERKITGTVGSDEGPGGYPGATVVVKGTSLGTSTDANGTFSLSVPATATTLVFSAVGMQTVEEVIGARTTINVRFRTDAKQLNEVVITAIGTKTK